jgi:DNA-binding NarL/FixJ family response regulator
MALSSAATTNSLAICPAMETTKISTIIVSRPGVMQDALRAVLASFDWIALAGVAGDALSGLNLVNDNQPDLLVIDSNLLPAEIKALVVAVKQLQPAPRCLVLCPSERPDETWLSTGADRLLPRSSSLWRLGQTLAQLGGVTLPDRAA